jgi:hypothetical protein
LLAGILVAAVIGASLARADASRDAGLRLAQAMVPPTGMGEKDMAMAAEHMAAKERMARRYPQPVRVGDLLGLPVLDEASHVLGRVERVVRTPSGGVELIISYGGWFGYGARPVAVPIEVVGILGRQIASLDMPASEYAQAPTWHPGSGGDAAIPSDDMIRIALARR